MFVKIEVLLLVVALVILVSVWISLVLSKRFGRDVSNLNDKMAQEKMKYRQMKQQMTNNIAHELRTPVSSIRGYLETLSNCPDLDSERRQSFVDKAYAQSIRLSDLIRDIALLSMIEDAPEQLRSEMLNVRSVFGNVLEEYSTLISTRGDVVENMLPVDLTVNGNQVLIYAIFRNLVENSLKYAGDNVTLHIECSSQKGKNIRFVYYDTGVGVGQEHIKRIFERFYRVSEGRTRDAGGSGLGLSIVRNAVAFHGGEISAHRHNGGGLEYRFTLKS